MVDHGDGTKRCWFANVGVVIDQFDRSVNSHSTHFLTFLIESETGIRTLALLEPNRRRSLGDKPFFVRVAAIVIRSVCRIKRGYQVLLHSR